MKIIENFDQKVKETMERDFQNGTFVYKAKTNKAPYRKIVEVKDLNNCTPIYCACAFGENSSLFYEFVTNQGVVIGSARSIREMEKGECKEVLYESIIRESGSDPEVVGHIPAGLFHERESLGEEILTEYQAIRLSQNQAMPVNVDRTEFVENIKKEVKAMNEYFNNAEKSKTDIKADLFARDREV